MGSFKKVGRVFEKAIHSVGKLVTRSARHQIEDQYHTAVAESARLEQEALIKLQAQYKTESDKAAAQIKQLQEALRNNEAQFKLEQDKVHQYLEEKGKVIQEAFEHITRSFKALRAALWACVTGKEENIEQFVKPVLKRDLGLKARFLALCPLHIAAQNNHLSLITLLLREGADPQGRNPQGDSPIDIAEERGLREAVQALKVPTPEETVALWRAVEAEDMAAIKIALEREVALNACLPNGYTILQQAVIDKKPYEIIRWLVEKGADYYQVFMRDAVGTGRTREGSRVRRIVTREVAKVPVRAAALGSEVSGWYHIRQFNQSPKIIAESEALIEAAGRSQTVPSIIRLANRHPDWRVRDFLMDRIGLWASTRLHPAWQSSLKDTQIEEGSRALKFGNGQQLGFMTIDNQKQFFALSFIGQHSSCPLIHYHFAQKSWQSHSLGLQYQYGGKTNTIGQQLQKLSIMPKTKEGQEQLLILTSVLVPHQGDHLMVWRYEPEAQRWQAGCLGPHLSGYSSIERTEMCAGREALFLLRQKTSAGNELELQSYRPRSDEWVPESCTMAGVLYISDGVRNSRPQLCTLQTKDGVERLFVFLLRNNVFELYNYESITRIWTLHRQSPWSGGWGKPFPILQMQKVTFQGESRLFFLELSLTGMKLWDFNPETGDWIHHTGGPSWYLTESGCHPSTGLKEPLAFIQCQTIPSYEASTDIILLFKQTFQAPTECYAYLPHPNPINRKWVAFPIPGLADSVWQDKENRAHICVERFGNQHRLLLFEKREQVFENLLDYPLSISEVERALNAAPRVSASLMVFSEEEHQRAILFLARLASASQALLSAARRGNWPAVFESLAQGADIHATDEGSNALQLALQHPSIDLGTLDRLLKAGLAVRAPMLTLARRQGRVLHNYLAEVLDKPAILVFDARTQFRYSYTAHLDRAQQFLDKYPDDVQKCKAILNYYRLVSAFNPYAVYVWPAMVLLGELLLLPKEILGSLTQTLRQFQAFFMQTLGVHRALVEVGVQYAAALRADSEFAHSDWTYIIAAIHLKEAADSLESTTPETLRLFYERHTDLLMNGTRAAVSLLAHILNLEPAKAKELVEWLVTQQPYAPRLLRESYKHQFSSLFDILASVSQEAVECHLLVLPPKMGIGSSLQILDQQEQAAQETAQRAEQDFLKEKAELTEWLDKQEAEYLTCVRELQALLASAPDTEARLQVQLQQATLDLKAQFTQFRRELEGNKADALRRVRHQALKGLVVMAAACCIASAAAPALAAAIGGPGALTLSKTSLAILEKILAGGIMGGIQAGFSKGNIGSGILKGGIFAGINGMLGGTLGAGVRATIERRSIEKSMLSALSSDLGAVLFIGTPDLTASTSFMQGLRQSLATGLLSGSVEAAVYHRDFGSSVAASTMHSVVGSAATAAGSAVGVKLADRMSTPRKRINAFDRLAETSSFPGAPPVKRLTKGSESSGTSRSHPARSNQGSRTRASTKRSTVSHSPSRKASHRSSGSRSSADSRGEHQRDLLFAYAAHTRQDPTEGLSFVRETRFDDVLDTPTARDPVTRQRGRLEEFAQFRDQREHPFSAGFQSQGLENEILHPRFKLGELPIQEEAGQPVQAVEKSRERFSLPSTLPEHHPNPILNVAFRVGRAIERSRDGVADIVRHPIENAKELAVLGWDLGNGLSRTIDGPSTEGSRIRNQERLQGIENLCKVLATGDWTTRLEVGTEITTGLIFTGGLGVLAAGARAPATLRALSSLPRRTQQFITSRNFRSPITFQFNASKENVFRISCNPNPFSGLILKLQRPWSKKDVLSERARLHPEPLFKHEEALVMRWQIERLEWMERFEIIDLSKVNPDMRILLRKPYSQLRDHMTPDDFAAILKEQRGIEIPKPKGGRYDHLRTEWRFAKQSFENALKGPWSGSLEEATVLNQRFGNISRLWDRFDKLIERAKCNPETMILKP